MSHQNHQSNDGDQPEWATKLSLAQFTVLVLLVTIAAIALLVSELSSGASARSLIFPLCILLFALILWRAWFKLRKSRSTWYTDE